MRNFVFEEGVVLFVVFVPSSCRVQKYLVDKYYVVDQFYSILFVGYYSIVVDFA